jgi:3D (Asp-Asp-Asp) domain-containing protein
MKYLLIFTIAILTSCGGGIKYAARTKCQEVRLTAYSRYEDHWTARGLTSTGKPLISYKTAAADPRDFPYGTVVHIKELKLKVTINDTGSALKSRKAARMLGKNVPVIDLYIASASEMRKFANSNPHFVTVTCE